MKTVWMTTSVVVLALCVGCSGKVKLSGTVLYSDDSAPVESGMIYFVSQNKPFIARGAIRDGAFVVSSVKENDGLPLGTYAVYFAGIEKVVKEGRMLDNGDYVEPETAPAVAMRYLSASTSGITLTVDGSFKTVEYKLERD